MNTWGKFIKYCFENYEKILLATQQHIFYLVLIPVSIAILIAVPLGIICTRWKMAEKVILALINILQTIPSLALLAFMITLGFGIGYPPAIIAITLYALLPIASNTYAGIKGVDPSIKEASMGMGMTGFQRLLQVELPIAMPIIITGIRTAAVISVGSGTIAAFIGAGGLGQLITTGLSQVRNYIILAGAIPSALLAIIVDRILVLAGRWLIPKGLRN